jgi:hypothetical protein
MTRFDVDKVMAEVRSQRRAAAIQHTERVAAGRALYTDSEGRPTLLPSFALYLDELGAKDRLLNLTNDELREDLQNYDDLRWFLHDEANWDQETQRALFFSDNVIVAAPIRPEDDCSDLGLFFQVFSAATYQLNMAIRGRFLRGGMAAGDLYADHSFVTGAALVRAVLLEEHVANTPRVLLDEVCTELARREVASYRSPEHSAHGTFLLKDADDKVFVNYLLAASEDEGVNPGVTEIGLRGHRDRVSECMLAAAQVPKVLAKYSWAAAYHNYVVTDFYDRTDLTISGAADVAFERFT